MYYLDVSVCPDPESLPWPLDRCLDQSHRSHLHSEGPARLEPQALLVASLAIREESP